MWTKKERVDAVLRGELADRAPISGWRHFTDKEHSGPEMFAQSMTDFQRAYDWDYVKLQPRASHFCEAWGAEYDYEGYNGGVVAPCLKPIITSEKDFDKFVELTGDEAIFQEQLQAVKLIVGNIPDAPVFHTLFCPAGILQMSFGVNAIGRYRDSARDDSFITAITHYPQQVHHALRNIAVSMANYAQKLARTGAYGVFYGALGMARTGYLTQAEWNEFVRPYDLIVMEALKPLKIMVHTCGIHANPQWFTDMPIDILHWAESAPGNPKLDSAPGWIGSVTPMGGVDERLFGENKAPQIAQMAKATIKRMEKIPFLLAPDCSLSVKTSDAEMRAFRNSVEK